VATSRDSGGKRADALSDNPELLNVGVEDDGSLDAVIASLNAKINDMAMNAAGAFDNISASAQGFLDSTNSTLGQFIDQLNGVAPAADASIGELVNQLTNADDVLKQYMADLTLAAQEQSDLSGAGAFGDGGGGGDTGGGGGFGAARGVRGAANLARIAGAGTGVSNAIMGGADILLISQGFEKITDIIPGLTSAVEGLGNQLIGAIPAFEGLGASGAGMVAVLGPAVALIAGVAAGIAIFNEEISASKKALDEALASVDSYFKAIQQGTTESLTKELDNLTVKKNAEDETLAFLQSQYDTQKAALEASGNQLGEAALEHSALADKINKLKDSTKDTAGEVEGLTRALTSTSVLINDMVMQAEKGIKAAQAAQAGQDQAVIDAANKQTALHRQEVTDLQGTSAAVENRLSGLQGEKAGLQENIDLLKASGDTSEAVRKHIDDLQNSMVVLDARIQNINDGLPAIQAHEAAIKSDKDAVLEANKVNAEHERLINSIISAQNAYNKAIETARDNLTNQLADLATKEKTGEQKEMLGSTEDTFARDTIALKEQRTVATIEEDTGNKIADIRTKLGETEVKAVTDLNRQLYDDQVNYQDNRQKLITSEHNQEQVDAIDHANKLADIRHNATINEMDDIANRDFIKLAKDQQTAADSVQKEDTSFTQKEASQRTHLQQQENDLTTALARQEKQQQTAEERKIADAETAADNSIAQTKETERRKIEVAQDAMQQQLADLTRNETEKLTLMREAYYQQFTMLQIQENQREQIAQTTEDNIVNHAQAILAQGTSSFIDDLNRLRAMSAGTASSSSVGIPGSSSVPAPSNWQTLNPPAAATNSAPDILTVAGTLADAVGNALQGMFA
jgi:hypothetical protein